MWRRKSQLQSNPRVMRLHATHLHATHLHAMHLHVTRLHVMDLLEVSGIEDKA